MRVGGREELKIDTRVVAATNAELEQSVKEGNFREDLYFRLAVVVLNLPPLRERGGDATLLAQAFLGQFADENGKDELVFTPETLRAIGNFAWPGNVRELQNRVQRAVIMAEGKRISIADMELAAAGSETALGETLKEAKERLERADGRTGARDPRRENHRCRQSPRR